VRGWLGDNDEMPNDEMPDHAPAYLSPSLPSPPDMCLKSKSDGACLLWFSIHGLGVGDSHLPQFGWAIEPKMRFFGRNGCSDFITSYDWSQPMRFLGRPKFSIYWVDIINSPVHVASNFLSLSYLQLQILNFGLLYSTSLLS
jgi:hypothetical protein